MKKLEEMRNVIFSCMGCGDCGYSIRSSIGKFKVCPVKEVHDSPFEVYFSRGRMMLAKGILDGHLTPSKELAEIVYQCTCCGACHDTCHNSHNESVQHFITRWIDHDKVWEAFREDLVTEGFAPLDQHARILNSLKNPENLNPYEKKAEEKRRIIANLEGFVQKGESNIGLFAGCTYPFQYQATLQNLGKLFQTLGVKIVKIPDEVCCGSVAFRIGDKIASNEMIMRNKLIFKEYSLQTLIVPCSGCYRTLKLDYKDAQSDAGNSSELPKIVHITEYLEELFSSEANREKINEIFHNTDPLTVVYHDPCHLGRHANVYDAPRAILKKIPGVTLVEMKRFGHNAWCCGAGGGMKSQFPEIALKIAQSRIEEALETHAQYLVTSCPFCVRNLSDANLDNTPIKVIDIMDFLAFRMFN